MKYTLEQVNPHSCLTYLVGAEGMSEIMLVDPVLEHLSDYLSNLDQQKYKLAQVVDTHTHADHISGAAALKDATGCEYLMHADAAPKCADVRVAGGMLAWR